jgi:uncharacterized protein YggE
MRHRHTRMLGLVGLTALLLAAASCSNSKPPTVNVSNGQQASGISVTGVGKVSGAPDSLTLTLGVSLNRETANDATTAASEKADAVIDALKAAGVGEQDIQTSNYSVSPEYDYNDGRQTPTGYRVSNTVTATIRDLDQAGATIDAAVEAGGNDATVQGVSFKLEDNAEAVEQARAAAFEDAERKAQQFADLSGRPLGDVQSVEQTSSTEPVPVPMAADRATAEATPIEPGEVSTDVTVSVRWSFG